MNNKAIVVPTADPYVLALLNSRIMWWTINRVFQHMKDDGLSIDVQFLRLLPVPDATHDLRDRIGELVGQMVDPTMSPNSSGEVADLERRLDSLVSEAFGIAKSETEVLIGSLPPRDPLQVALSQVEV